MHNTGKIIYNGGDSVCNNCGREYIYNKKKGHSRSICNTCKANKRRVTIKKRMVDYLGGCCSVCKYSKSLNALQFHHRDPSQKELRLADSYRRKWSVIVAELEKCDLLCANCHAEHHDKDLTNGLDSGLSIPEAGFNSL